MNLDKIKKEYIEKYHDGDLYLFEQRVFDFIKEKLK